MGRASRIPINEIITEFCLYDEYVICKDGWTEVSTEIIDEDRSKNMRQYHIILSCDKHNTWWQVKLWDAYDGVDTYDVYLDPIEKPKGPTIALEKEIDADLICLDGSDMECRDGWAHIDTEHLSCDHEKGFQDCRMIIYRESDETYWATEYTILNSWETDILEQKFTQVFPHTIDSIIYKDKP